MLLQKIVDSDDALIWPALLLKPAGKAISPKSNLSFSREDSFFGILKTSKHAHSPDIS